MIKIKIVVVAVFLSLVGIVFLNSNHPISAKGDALEEIAEYKTWAKINKNPIRVDLDIDLSGG